jgi:flavin reductase (DIM6/NTAB) family NADH-FMN oxidoreductase RutF
MASSPPNQTTGPGKTGPDAEAPRAGSQLAADADGSERMLRDAFGAFATGVAVVLGTDQRGAPIGLTISSFNSLSLSPPLILFSLRRSVLSFSAWQQTRGYSVNVLGAAQESIANRFGRASPSKWDGIDVTVGRFKVPVLPDALASFECVPHARFDGGDHEIFVGRVVDFRLPKDIPPLVFFRGQYRTLSMAVPTEASGIQIW